MKKKKKPVQIIDKEFYQKKYNMLLESKNQVKEK